MFETECGIRVVDVVPWTRKACTAMTIITRAARSPFPALSTIDAAITGSVSVGVGDDDEGILSRSNDTLDEALTEEECACLPKKDASFHQRSRKRCAISPHIFRHT